MSAAGRVRKPLDIWASLGEPQAVASILILYCAFHFLLRLALSANFTLDESEQILFAQSLQWGYRFRHPPLITWLSWATLAASGQSRVAFFLLKYVLMGLGLLAYFEAGRVVIRDTRLAALATFALLTTFVMGFMPHVDLMHTVLLATMLAAWLWADARVITSGKLTDYLLLGVITGLGILSKYVFIVLPIAMTIAVAFVPRFRARLKLVPLLAAVLVAAAIVAPYAIWAQSHEYSLFALAQTITKSSGPALSPLSWLKGTGNLVVALAGFLVPMIAIFPLLYWRACKPLTGQGDADDRSWLRLYEIAMVAGVVIMWGAVFFVGTEAFKPRWMHQVAMMLPIYLFLRVKLAGVGERADKIFAIVALVFALGIFAARAVIYETDGSHCKTCREYWPMQTYAQDLRRAGFAGGTIVAPTYDLAGNLRGIFPDARVVTPGYPLAVFGPPVGGQCLAVWEGLGEPPKAMLAYLADPMGATVSKATLRGDITAQLLTTHRFETMSYMLLPGVCH
ncbi:MAG TPA: glycosyltransferase family 39 protein [Rhizomicrobium sp.]|nr:glycosyltransferase family 39 protein [Rhizomicrobium sp.]